MCQKPKNAKEMEDFIIDTIQNFEDEQLMADEKYQPTVASIINFSDDMILTKDNGFTMYMEDNSEYRVIIRKVA